MQDGKCPICETMYRRFRDHEKSPGHKSMLKTIKEYLKNPNASGRDELIEKMCLLEKMI